MSSANLLQGPAPKKGWTELLEVTSDNWEQLGDGYTSKIEAQIRRRQAKRHSQLKRRGKITYAHARHRPFSQRTGGTHAEYT